VSHISANRNRIPLSLRQPTRTRTNGFGWDLAGRLANVAPWAGAFGYTHTHLYTGLSSRLLQEVSLPNGAYFFALGELEE
jgi:hypothetical protein